MRNKILVIPGAFVPYNDTVTLISYKHLRNINADFDVVALKGKEDEGLKKSLLDDNRMSNFSIEYVCDYDAAVATYERKNVLSGIYNLLKYCFYAKKKAKQKDYDIVYTSSIPAFTHLAGYWIKKMKGADIIWVASISDPLYKSPYKYDKETIKEYNLLAKIGFYVFIWIYMNGYYEKICQKYADKIIYICEEERDFCVEHYKNKEELVKKSMIIPLNYIEEWDIYKSLYLSKRKSKNKPIIVSHFGRVYGLRKIDNFLIALKQMKLSNENLANEIQFFQYGEFNQRYKNQIEMLELSDLFVFHDKISYDDVMTLMEESDALALFDTIMPENNKQPYLPSKSLEYILLKKPLLIITTQTSPSYRIFKDLGYEVAKNDVRDIIKSIENLFHNNEYDYDIEKFENKNVTLELKKYMEASSKERNQDSRIKD
ncbi:MAG: glycosyltransferase [Erysipelotrichales bacterium]|nr:glycosyltransferase [Erysipelotrichales bacterium]